MSALACLAERPSLIERLFVTKEVNQHGIYRVKLCKNGEWVTVTIDDYFPCFPLGEPLFSRGQGNELWVLILEKAYAKLHGNYFNLRGGFANEALIDLTGCPARTYIIEEENLEELWENIRIGDEEGYLLCASTVGEDRWIEQGVVEDEDSNGQLPGHAYSILQVKEVCVSGGQSYRLLNLRNPWGNFEWKGDWSDMSPLWTEEIKQKIQPNFSEEDGSFWMNYDDFQAQFYCVNCCKVRNWDEVRIKGKFIRVQEIDDPKIEQVVSKWYYTIEVQEKAKVSVSIHQEDERSNGVALLRPYQDIGIAILKKKNDGNVELINFTDFEFDRQVEQNHEFEEPGTYIILPRTSGCLLRKPGDASNEKAVLQDRFGNISIGLKSTIQDIFRKFDMLLNRELTYVEFKGFYECINKTITEDEYKTTILDRYPSSNKGLSQTGFYNLWKDSILNFGEVFFSYKNIGRCLQLVGIIGLRQKFIFNKVKGLYHDNSQVLFLSYKNSSNEISTTVRDAVQTDLDNKTNSLIIKERGTDMETCQENQGVKARYYLSK